MLNFIILARNISMENINSEYLTLPSTEFYQKIGIPNFRKKFEQLLYKKSSPKELLEVLKYIYVLAFDTLEFRYHDLITIILNDNVFDNLVRLVQNVSMSLEVCLTIIEFYESIVHYVPHCEIVYEKVQTLFELTLVQMDKSGEILEFGSHLFERMSELIAVIEKKDYYISKNDVSYMYLDLYPSDVDIYDFPVISPLILKGPYTNSSHYLDNNFKVLREDFVSFVREGLCVYRKISSKNKSNQNNYFYVYSNIKSKNISTSTKSKICHLLQFSDDDIKWLRRENWDFSKKFMVGSLLLFSRNNFITFFVATVEENLSRFSNRDIYIKVSIVGNPHQFKADEYYTMLESKAFFEPYYQSLKILQEIDPFNFPLAEEIILCDKTTPAAYISSELSEAMQKCLEEIDLNESQKIALNASLNQKFTLIQGPPGTGKSFLTRKIISILASDTSDKRPILVVCMRNRAVDIILEPLVESGLKIIRFGRTDSETILPHTFSEFRLRHIPGDTKPCAKCLRKRLIKIRKVIVSPGNIKNQPLVEECAKLDSQASDALKLSYDYHVAHILLSHKVEIIGATTTGAAKRNKLINEMNPKAVIIEEAAEMLEVYAITCLPQSCDRIILIGDHQQLRPQPSMHLSAQKYNLKISLFERLLNNGKIFYSLNEQHRMRKEICELVSPLIYKKLSNHLSVHSFPDVMGMEKNLFFMTHQNSEECKGENSSYYNSYEGDVLISLANYLTCQGYGPDEITILAAYSAQQMYITQAIKKYRLLQDIEIQTIDNYQGNENKIILLSLVRSNGNTVGFLSMPNRINVAFTRAQHGLFMVGNMETLTKCSYIWREFNKLLVKRDSIGSGFPFTCKIHYKKNLLSSPKEIDCLTLAGGCTSICKMKKECGHFCTTNCHVSSVEDVHHRSKCQQPCLRKKKCGNHNCLKLCYEDCELECEDICFVQRPVELQCSHSITVIGALTHLLKSCNNCARHDIERGLKLCSKDCQQCLPKLPKVNFVLSCGHEAYLRLTDLNSYVCRSRCDKFLCLEEHIRCPLECHSGPCPQCMTLVQKYDYCCHDYVPCSLFKYQPLSTCQIRLMITYSCGHKYHVRCGEHKSNTMVNDKCKKCQSSCFIV